jgi:tetratricopeptide (TPR) repeat protein
MGRVGLRHYDVTHRAQFRPTAEQHDFLGQAFSAYSEAIGLNPDDDVLWHNRGWIRLAAGETPAAAISDFQQAVRIDGGTAVYHYSLAYVYGLQGERSRELDEYARAVEAEPDILDSRMSEQMQSTSPQLWTAILKHAVSDLEAGEKSDPNIQARLGGLYVSRGGYERARAILSSLTVRFPQLPRPWRNLAKIYLLEGHIDQAAEYLRKAIALDHTDCIAWLQLSTVARDRQHERRADELLFHASRACRTRFSNRAHRVRRIYGSTAIASDDLLPPGLLWYLEAPTALKQQPVETWQDSDELAKQLAERGAQISFALLPELQSFYGHDQTDASHQ